jgi:DNA-binding CsgD family transcriptional regulator
MSKRVCLPVSIETLVDSIYDDIMAGRSLQVALDATRNLFAATFALLTIEERTQRNQQAAIVSGTQECLARYRRAMGTEPVIQVFAENYRVGQDDFRIQDLTVPRMFDDDHHVISSDLGISEDFECRLWLVRPRTATAFDAAEMATCNTLVAHIRRAVRITAKAGHSETERELYAGVMDKLLVGAVILDDRGTIIHSTATAAAILAERQGLQIVAGRPHATSLQDDRELQAAIKSALGDAGQTQPRALSLTRASCARDLGVVVQSLRGICRVPGGRCAAVAVFIRDPDCNTEVENDLVRQLFDLTPAEATIARRLASGLSLEEAALSLDISRNTARAHLRSIFSKSGITRQTELVRLMLNSAAVLGIKPRLCHPVSQPRAMAEAVSL